MKEIVINVSNSNARYWAWILRERYGKDKRTSLERLCEIAIRREVLAESEVMVRKAERKMEEATDG